MLVLPSQAEPWASLSTRRWRRACYPSCGTGSAAGRTWWRASGGLPQVYPCGDVGALTAASSRALARTGDPQLAPGLRQRVARYGVAATAVGFEQAVMAAAGRR